MVQQITVSLARGRVGFQTRVGMIMGSVTTDLKPGSYRLKLDALKRRWIITAPTVAGWRFEVSLEGADPWTLGYPDEIPMLVTAGSSVEARTFGEMLGPDGQLIDPLWLYENLPPELAPTPIAGTDDFESVHYDLSYRWEKGGLSKWLVVNYRDGTSKEINIDAINESTPKLMAAKKDVLKIMDDYNALFILHTFPTVFFILTVAPTVSAAGPKGPFSVRRTQVPKSRVRVDGKSPEPGTKTEPEPGGGKIEAEEASSFASQQRRAQELTDEIAKRGEKVVVNMGGAGARHEPKGAINVNNQSVPRKDIPNLVQADASKVGELFRPSSVDRFEGHNMAPGVIDWEQAAPGVHKSLRPGGTLEYYYRGANADAKAAEAALRKVQPPFQKVENIGDVVIKAVK
jgi:hypothetical protein